MFVDYFAATIYIMVDQDYQSHSYTIISDAWGQVIMSNLVALYVKAYVCVYIGDTKPSGNSGVKVTPLSVIKFSLQNKNKYKERICKLIKLFNI